MLLDSFTCGVLTVHSQQIERDKEGRATPIRLTGWRFCWEGGRLACPDAITEEFNWIVHRGPWPIAGAGQRRPQERARLRWRLPTPYTFKTLTAARQDSDWSAPATLVDGADVTCNETGLLPHLLPRPREQGAMDTERPSICPGQRLRS
jgi:hypothetical protein